MVRCVIKVRQLNVYGALGLTSPNTGFGWNMWCGLMYPTLEVPLSPSMASLLGWLGFESCISSTEYLHADCWIDFFLIICIKIHWGDTWIFSPLNPELGVLDVIHTCKFNLSQYNMWCSCSVIWLHGRQCVKWCEALMPFADINLSTQYYNFGTSSLHTIPLLSIQTSPCFTKTFGTLLHTIVDVNLPADLSRWCGTTTFGT